MSLKLDGLEMFKKHRNKISESLDNKFIGREKETNAILDLLSKVDFVAITGPAGVGKSRLAVAVIERYAFANHDVKVLCLKSFGDYVSAVEETIDDSKRYMFFIDDASDYKRITELLRCLKYHSNRNIKAIFTVRNYLKDCLDETMMCFYEIGPLSDVEIEMAVAENTKIKNEKWLKKVAKISKGNIRFAFVAADVALKNEKGFSALFNVRDIMNSFYKSQIVRLNGQNLLIAAGIIAFFKNVYLNQLYYISPLLKIVGISKRDFLRYADELASAELVDECMGVIKLSDQCFSDYLLNYVFIEKRYIRIKDLIVNTYKFYKKRIIESLNAILSTCLTEDLISYIKKEILDACALVEDTDLKRDIVVAFAPLALDYAAAEFKKGVEEYNDKKDLQWLLKVFSSLAKSDYNDIADEGIFRLMKKTISKKEDIFKAIDKAYSLDYSDVKSSFRHLNSFVVYLSNNGIYDERLLSLVSSYLKYSFRNIRFTDDEKLVRSSFDIKDYMTGIIPFRERCWDYVFDYGIEKSMDAIMDFVRYRIAEDTVNIVKSDTEAINKHLLEDETGKLIKEIIYQTFQSNGEKYGFGEMLAPSSKYSDFLHLLLEKKLPNQDYDDFERRHKERIGAYYRSNEANAFDVLNKILPIAKYYPFDIECFLSAIVECLDEFNSSILNVFVELKTFPACVVKKAAPIIGLQNLYESILSIGDESARDEYLYNFYTLIGELNVKETFGFETWLKSKKDLNVRRTHSRDVLSLSRVAKNAEIGYVALIKAIFKKKEYNVFLAKEYLSSLLSKEKAFEEIIGLDEKLAIEIYEFLVENGEIDYGYKILRVIVSVKRNFIKKIAKRFIDEKIQDADGLDEIVFDGDNCKRFFDECVKIGENELPCFSPFGLQRFVSDRLENQAMIDWILECIDKKWSADKTMKSLFSILAGIDPNYRNRFIVKYYEKGKNLDVLKCALSNNGGFYSLSSIEACFKREIESLRSLKSALLKWDNLGLTFFIDKMIEGYKNDIEAAKIDQLMEHIDYGLLRKLQELDARTEISLGDAFKLYTEDENFRRMLSSGYVSYNEGSFRTKSNCPLKFVDVLKDKKIFGVKLIPFDDDRDDRYEDYLSSMCSIANRFSNEKRMSLDECLWLLFNEKEWDANVFGEETSLSKDLFSKIKNNERNKLVKTTLVKILIGLRLSKDERNFLLELNGTPLSIYDVDDVLYSFILDLEIDIDTADSLLKDLGKKGFIKEFSD